MDGNAVDSSGQDNDGTEHNVLYSAGKIGNAGNFDGTSRYIEVADDPSLEPENVTLEACELYGMLER